MLELPHFRRFLIVIVIVGTAFAISSTGIILASPTNAGASSASKQTIAMIRSDVKQSELQTFFSSYPPTYHFSLITSPGGTTTAKVSGAYMLMTGSRVTDNTISNAKSAGATMILFDEEPINWNDYDSSLIKTHSAGLKLGVTPNYTDITQSYNKLAKADLVVFQIHPMNGFAQTVQKYSGLIKNANPSCIIIEQFDTGTEATGNGDVTAIEKAYDSIKSVTTVDGFLVYYFATPDPIPDLTSFYQHT